jgi:hypothetical protein
MATDAMRQQQVVVRRDRPANPAWDRVFFSGMILLLWVTVLFGFAKTYFMAGMVHAPLPNGLIHVHGAVFTLWMVLLLVQEVLIAGRKFKWHKQLGLAGFGLSVAMVVLGVLAATDALRRNDDGHSGLGAETFYAIPILGILTFAVLVYLAYRDRYKPAAHKRLILISTISLATAAVARWPVGFIQTNPPTRNLVILGFLLLVVAYDLLSLHRVLKTTIWSSVFVMALLLGCVPLGFTPAWHAFAHMMATVLKV